MPQPDSSSSAESRTPLGILFTDIVGSSEYFAKRGDTAGMNLVSRHNALLFPVVKSAGGRVVKTIGDSILATFENLGQAVRCAWAMQQALLKYNDSAPEEEKINVRIGVHYGLVFERTGDVFGDAVNMGERVKSKASGGQVFLSRVVRDMLRADPLIQVKSMGLVELKGSPEPIELYQLVLAPMPQAVQQAVAPPSRKNFGWIAGAVAAGVLVLALVGWRVFRSARATQAGNQADSNNSTQAADTSSKPIAVANVSLRYSPAGGTTSDVLPVGAVFHSGDKFQISIQPLRSICLYAALFDASKQNFDLFFPEKETIEPLEAGQPFTMPQEHEVITLDKNPKMERVLLILSQNPIPQLAGLARSGKSDDASLVDILEKVRTEASAHATFVPGPGPGMNIEASLGSHPAWLELHIDHR
ncbi:MAG: adenylate/guanylate cyclase domain-containing protein [Candidatus Acidiferrales bacterium]